MQTVRAWDFVWREAQLKREDLLERQLAPVRARERRGKKSVVCGVRWVVPRRYGRLRRARARDANGRAASPSTLTLGAPDSTPRRHGGSRGARRRSPDVPLERRLLRCVLRARANRHADRAARRPLPRFLARASHVRLFVSRHRPSGRRGRPARLLPARRRALRSLARGEAHLPHARLVRRRRPGDRGRGRRHGRLGPRARPRAPRVRPRPLRRPRSLVRLLQAPRGGHRRVQGGGPPRRRRRSVDARRRRDPGRRGLDRRRHRPRRPRPHRPRRPRRHRARLPHLLRRVGSRRRHPPVRDRQARSRSRRRHRRSRRARRLPRRRLPGRPGQSCSDPARQRERGPPSRRRRRPRHRRVPRHRAPRTRRTPRRRRRVPLARVLETRIRREDDVERRRRVDHRRAIRRLLHLRRVGRLLARRVARFQTRARGRTHRRREVARRGRLPRASRRRRGRLGPHQQMAQW